ncbi:MAG: glycosyltransferase family 9 protein [Bryobacterales bacterium]|nr:glycosyltransferase family 9 protein [Bryobacterales bacterium]
MATTLDRLGEGSRVAVVRLRSLGDCVLTTPALHLLKKHRPDLRVGVVVEPRFRAVYSGNAEVDEILPPGVGAVRAFRPGLVLNLHGGTRSAVLTAASGAGLRAGFGHYRYGMLYNVRIPRAQEILGVERKVHTAEHVASAMFYLGVPQGEIPRARLYPSRDLAGGPPYAVIHPFASQADKAWAAERFLEVAARLEGMGMEPMFIGTPADGLYAFEKYRTFTPALEETKSLLAGASFFLGNDSGPAHMAAAFGVPMAVIFAASDVEVWRPWKTRAETIVAEEGMGSVGVDRVVEAMERLGVRG